MRRKYTISDGKMVLVLQEAAEGGYIVTSPLDPELITEAETVPEAFENARDAVKAAAGITSQAPASHGLGYQMRCDPLEAASLNGISSSMVAYCTITTPGTTSG